ncbi:transcriptional regulator, HxlR family [Pedobacter sp. ok626]|uniref:winged helix-turn-helix transcriptional regulator n=1 Tax=Pedobacter sp. ok626 TaxID=1761882 RepID=UPI00088222F3|nr:helix-turn-helix domain-containing protein [Pedobacter sp. ok626]SDL10963.1 transcriptional regulator, HxlR family [Pedobacter sp. ok626]
MDKDEMTTHQKIRYVQDTLFVISGKWKLPILIAISQGSSRFREIQRNVPFITTKVLSKELKDLEINKLVSRTVSEDSSVRIEYKVSPYCKSLAPLVDEMIIWAVNHRRKISEE